VSEPDLARLIAEIEEQPGVVARLLDRQADAVRQIADMIRARDPRAIVLVARGSSDNAALFGRYLLEIQTGIPVSLAAPSVYTLYDARVHLDHALVIGVSQSGEGDDINLNLERSRACGALTVGITNEPRSSMTNLVDEVLLMHGGRERSVAATKTYTGQMMLFYMLARALAANGAAKLDYEKIPEYAERALALRATVEEVVTRYVFMENCVVVGRGLSYSNAFEMALKLMETCYVVTTPFSAADFLHGPLALVERHFPIFLFAPPGLTLSGAKALMERLRELRADTLAITGDEEAATLASRALRVPSEIEEFIAPIPYILPGQLFAALLAEAKGLDPDAPRSLSKVTRTL